MMQNMCCASTDGRAAVGGAQIGVLAFVAKDGTPRACPVTPYLVGEEAVVSSTLAFTAKVAAVRRNPNVALLAGGWLHRGSAEVEVDLSSRTFDEDVRGQELRKYPPSRPLLSIPGHRRALWWYVGRATIRIPMHDAVAVHGHDRVTATFVTAGTPSIVPLPADIDTGADEIAVPAEVRGPTVVLVHEEDRRMADLRQVTLTGTAADGILRVHSRAGTIEPARASALEQLRTLRQLARQARRNRHIFERWAAQQTTPR